MNKRIGIITRTVETYYEYEVFEDDCDFGVFGGAPSKVDMRRICDSRQESRMTDYEDFEFEWDG